MILLMRGACQSLKIFKKSQNIKVQFPGPLFSLLFFAPTEGLAGTKPLIASAGRPKAVQDFAPRLA